MIRPTGFSTQQFLNSATKCTAIHLAQNDEKKKKNWNQTFDFLVSRRMDQVYDYAVPALLIIASSNPSYSKRGRGRNTSETSCNIYNMRGESCQVDLFILVHEEIIHQFQLERNLVAMKLSILMLNGPSRLTCRPAIALRLLARHTLEQHQVGECASRTSCGFVKKKSMCW